MLYLQQLIRTVETHTITTPILYSQAIPEQTLFHRLYTGIRNGVYTSDDSAARDIYKQPASSARYRSLKSELCRRLESFLFFIRFPDEASSLRQTRYQCRRILFLAWTLIEDGSMVAAGTLAKRIIARAQKYELSRTVLECAEILRIVAASIGQSKQYNYYSALCSSYSNIVEAEQMAQSYFDHVIFLLSTSASNTTLAESIQRYCAECDILRQQWNTYNLAVLSFRLEIYRCNLAQNYEQAIHACTKLENILTHKPWFDSPAQRAEIVLYKNACRLHLRDYDSGLQESQQYERAFAIGSDNWFAFKQSCFLLALHKGDYTQAQTICTAARNTCHEGLPFQQNDLWNLYADFLAIAQGKSIVVQPNNSVFVHDKEGLNIPLLFRDIVALIQAGRYSEVLVRSEALRKYTRRYISPLNRRSAIFMQMLHILLREDCRYESVVKETKGYVQKLSSEKCLDSIEILPYEVLWNSILHQLPSSNLLPLVVLA